MSFCPTPHIRAEEGDFAKTVLMPGDPLRSEFIARRFLTDARLVNNVRGVQGYTGFYAGCRVSVMASGMGMPSMGIYSHELYRFFGVENILRVGSAGAIREDIALSDIVIGMGACTNSAFAAQFHLPGTFAPICDYRLLSACVSEAEDMSLPFHVGNLLSSDTFYDDVEGLPESLTPVSAFGKMGVAAIEMEAAALYMNAARFGKKALAVCTVSDQLLRGERLTAEERQNNFTAMIELALRTAATIERGGSHD